MFCFLAGHAQTEDNPLILQVNADSLTVMPDSYVSYTAAQSGLLVLRSNAYAWNTESDGWVDYFVSIQDSTVWGMNILVDAGQTYVFHMSTTEEQFKLVATFEQPAARTLYNPEALTAGSAKAVPDDAGMYYFKYTATADGFANISSPNALTDGSVRVYERFRYMEQTPYSTCALSNTNSYATRFAVKAGTTYYINVVKNQALAGDSFTLSYEAAAAGDTEANPINVTSEEQFTVKNIVGKSYYAITVPAGSDRLITVTVTGKTSSSTNVYVYNSADTTRANVLSLEEGCCYLSGAVKAGQGYLIEVAPVDESAALALTVQTRALAAGDLITNPLTANTVMNNISGTGTKYYKFTATTTGKLYVTPTAGTTDLNVSYPRGVNAYDGYYEMLTSDKYIEVTKDSLYYIKFVDVANGQKFRVNNVAFKFGESRTKPADVTAGSFAVTSTYNKENLWLKYTAASSGILTIACNWEYDPSNCTVGYCHEDSLSLNYMGNPYSAEIDVVAGESYFVNVKRMNASAANDTVTFTLRAAGNGESYLTPIVITKGEEFAIPMVSNRSMPYWCKVSMEANSSIELQSKDYICGYWYAGADNAAAGSYEEDFYMEYTADYLSRHHVLTASTAGDYYIAFYGNFTQITMTVVDYVASSAAKGNGGVTGINEVKADNTAEKVYYTIGGVRVANPAKGGLYILNGKKVIFGK